MIKQTISYTDYNDEQVTEELWFHITKGVLTQDLSIADEFTAISEVLDAKQETDTLEISEVQTILDLVKRLVRMSYGVRSEDGKKFRQRDELWDDFHDSAAYDTFLFGMFEDTSKAIAFMTGIMPKDLIEAAKAEAGPKVPQDHLKKETPAPVLAAVPFEGDVETTPTETPEERKARLQAELDALN